MLSDSPRSQIKKHFCHLKFFETWYIYSSSIYELTQKKVELQNIFLKQLYFMCIYTIRQKNPDFLSSSAHTSSEICMNFSKKSLYLKLCM
jgi:hypothetical protein